LTGVGKETKKAEMEKRYTKGGAGETARRKRQEVETSRNLKLAGF